MAYLSKGLLRGSPKCLLQETNLKEKHSCLIIKILDQISHISNCYSIPAHNIELLNHQSTLTLDMNAFCVDDINSQ